MNEYDYGARMYDPALGRFHTLDPIAEDYSLQSPYVYAANDPIRYIDWMGMAPDDPPYTNIIRAATGDNVSKNNDKYNEAVSKAGTLKVSAQAGGIGGEMKVGSLINVKGEVNIAQLEVSSNKSISANIVNIEGEATINSIGPKANLDLGNAQVSENGTETSIAKAGASFKGGDFSADNRSLSFTAKLGVISVTTGVDFLAIGDAIKYTVEAVESFAKNLFTETTNNSFNTDYRGRNQNEFIKDKYGINK